MTCECFPLITDKVCRCAKQTKITIPQSFSGSSCHLIFDNISDNIFGKVVLHDHHVPDDWFLSQGNSLFDRCKIHMQQLSWTIASKRLQWCNRRGGLKFPTMATFLDAVSEVANHAWPPELFLHERQGVTLSLMCCISVTAV